MELAPDQGLQEAEQLVGRLHQEANQLTYPELQDRLAKVAESIRTLNQRRNDSFDAVDAAKAELQAIEAKLMIEHGGSYPRSHTRQWREKLDAALQKAAHLRNEEARLRQLSGVLSQEIHKRDSHREYLTVAKLREKHASQFDAKLAAACAAVAEAICAKAWIVGLAPGDIQPTLFVQNAMMEHIIRDEVQRFAEAKRKQAEAEVKADKMFGGGQ